MCARPQRFYLFAGTRAKTLASFAATFYTYQFAQMAKTMVRGVQLTNIVSAHARTRDCTGAPRARRRVRTV
jgi:hypothetical protein